MITIIDYGVGNINAFVNVYKRLDIPTKIANSAADLENVQKLILPGVGHFDHAMIELINSGMLNKLNELVLSKRIFKYKHLVIPDHISNDLSDAVNWILKKIK